MYRFFLLAGLAGSALHAQTTNDPVVLTIDVENYVQYRSDVQDPAKVAKDTNPTTGIVAAFLENTHIGDIVAVNGKPAKGVWQSHHVIIPFRASPAAGQAIADVNSRTQLCVGNLRGGRLLYWDAVGQWRGAPRSRFEGWAGSVYWRDRSSYG